MILDSFGFGSDSKYRNKKIPGKIRFSFESGSGSDNLDKISVI